MSSSLDSTPLTLQKIAEIENQLLHLKRAVFQGKKENKELEFPLSALLTNIGEYMFAFPLQAVEEVIYMVVVSPLPGAPLSVRGTINYRGQTVPVVDLAVGFFEQPTPLRTEMYLAVISAHDKLFAVPVHKLHGVSTFNKEDVESISDAAILAMLVDCIFHSEQGAISLLNPDRILAAGEYDMLNHALSESDAENSEPYESSQHA